jgi:DNA polymerase IV
MSVLCRDCLAFGGDRPGPRCEACGSPRIVRHAELDRLRIAHVDCDAFYAAVEKRDDPSLIDKPVIIGGGRRGVVSTACYVARTYGVRSAMPMFKALAVCPDAVVIKPNMDKYVRVAREIRAMMLALTPMVEPLSIDEAFLDLSGTERLHKRPISGSPYPSGSATTSFSPRSPPISTSRTAIRSSVRRRRWTFSRRAACR